MNFFIQEKSLNRAFEDNGRTGENQGLVEFQRTLVNYIRYSRQIDRWMDKQIDKSVFLSPPFKWQLVRQIERQINRYVDIKINKQIYRYKDKQIDKSLFCSIFRALPSNGSWLDRQIDKQIYRYIYEFLFCFIFRALPSNGSCCDCGSTNDVTWLSTNFGIIVCIGNGTFKINYRFFDSFYISSPTPHMNFRLPILTPPLPLKKGGFEKGSRNAYYFFEGNNSRILIQYFFLECSGIHREMGVHISKIQSLTLGNQKMLFLRICPLKLQGVSTHFFYYYNFLSLFRDLSLNINGIVLGNFYYYLKSFLLLFHSFVLNIIWWNGTLYIFDNEAH